MKSPESLQIPPSVGLAAVSTPPGRGAGLSHPAVLRSNHRTQHGARELPRNHSALITKRTHFGIRARTP